MADGPHHEVRHGSAGAARCDARLMRACLGGPLPWKSVVAAGLAVGALSFVDKLRMLDPPLLFLVPALFLHTVSRVYQFLRNPRAPDWAYVAGVSYEGRRRLAARFARMRMQETAAFVLLASAMLAVVRTAQFGLGDALGFSAGMILELAIFAALLFGVLRSPLVMPATRDPRRWLFPRLHRGAWRVRLGAFYLGLSSCARGLAPRDARPLLRRQWLYLFRCDWFAVFVLGAAGVIVAAIAVIGLSRVNGLAADVVLLVIPLFLFTQMSPALNESAGKLAECPYYGATYAQLLPANLLICLCMGLPYLAIFSVKTLLTVNASSIALESASFLVCFAALCFAFSVCWLRPVWTWPSIVLLVLTGLCDFAGVVGCHYGSAGYALLAPLTPIAVGWWVISDYVKTRRALAD